MFKTKIIATEETDVNVAILALLQNCKQANLANGEAQTMEQQCRDALTTLVERGSEMSELGSKMHVRQEVVGSGYAVEIIFQAGQKKNILRRIASALFLR